MTARMITPKGFDIKAMTKAVDNGLLAGVEDAKVLFFMTYHNWEDENQPDFDVIGPKTIAGSRVVEYSTDDEPYIFVSNGTPEHDITSKQPGGFLRFKAGSIPKTKPGQFQSMTGKAGTDWVTKDKVHNPGIEARNFPEHVVKRLSNLNNLVQTEIDEVVS